MSQDVMFPFTFYCTASARKCNHQFDFIKKVCSYEDHRTLFQPHRRHPEGRRFLAHALSDSIQKVDLCDRPGAFSDVSVEPDQLALIAVPSYGGRVPAVAIQRLAAVHGNGAPAILMVVYGNRAFEDTMAELEDTARQAGFKIAAGVAAVAEHSIVREFAAGRPDAQDQAQLSAFAARSRKSWHPATPPSRPFPAADPTRRRVVPAWFQNPPRDCDQLRPLRPKLPCAGH